MKPHKSKDGTQASRVTFLMYLNKKVTWAVSQRMFSSDIDLIK